MRRALLLAALLLAAPLRAALVVPAGGLPEGRLAPAAALGLPSRPIASERWSALQAVASAASAEHLELSSWAALPAADGRLAAAPLEALLPDTFWADAGRLSALPPARRAQLVTSLELARQSAAIVVDWRASEAVEKAQELINQGRFGRGDLADLSATLQALSIHGAQARAAALDARGALALARGRSEAATLLPPKIPEAIVVSDGRGDARRLARYDALGRAARYAGYGLYGAAAASLAHPQLAHLAPALTWPAMALTAASRFLRRPRGAAPVVIPEAGATRARGSFKTFVTMLRRAREDLAAHRVLDARVGGANVRAFRDWLSGGMRAALSWFPISLLGMLVGALAGAIVHGAGAHLASSGAGLPVQVVVSASFARFLNAFVAPSIAQEVVFLGVVYNAFAWALKKLKASPNKALFGAIAASLAVYAPLLVFTGYPASLFFTMAGIEAVILYVYGRSGSLLAAAGIRGMIALLSMESARMMAYLQVKPDGALTGAAPWTSFAAAGMLAVALLVAAKGGGLKAAAARQLSRLRVVGNWWTHRVPGAAPRSAWPMLSLGLLWAVPLLAGMDVVETLVHWLLPQAAPTPEILSRMLLMPLDVIAYNFIIVAALEEWIFRGGVFDSIRNRIKGWKLPQRWWFWPAAILSSLIFSGAHYVDFAQLLAHFGIGGGNGALASSLAGAYAFTWSSFLARAAGGMILAGIYAGSGSLLLPMIAHFGSNMLEGLGMRWGTWPLLALVAAILLMQLRPGTTDDAPRS